ncbi:hypothetical protein ACET3Z_025209 [Daucus carota]
MARQFVVIAALVVLFIVGMASTVSAGPAAAAGGHAAEKGGHSPAPAPSAGGEAPSAGGGEAGSALGATPADAPSAASSLQVSAFFGAFAAGVASLFI